MSPFSLRGRARCEPGLQPWSPAARDEISADTIIGQTRHCECACQGCRAPRTLAQQTRLVTSDAGSRGAGRCRVAPESRRCVRAAHHATCTRCSHRRHALINYSGCTVHTEPKSRTHCLHPLTRAPSSSLFLFPRERDAQLSPTQVTRINWWGRPARYQSPSAGRIFLFTFSDTPFLTTNQNGSQSVDACTQKCMSPIVNIWRSANLRDHWGFLIGGPNK